MAIEQSFQSARAIGLMLIAFGTVAAAAPIGYAVVSFESELVLWPAMPLTTQLQMVAVIGLVAILVSVLCGTYLWVGVRFLTKPNVVLVRFDHDGVHATLTDGSTVNQPWSGLRTMTLVSVPPEIRFYDGTTLWLHNLDRGSMSTLRVMRNLFDPHQGERQPG